MPTFAYFNGPQDFIVLIPLMLVGIFSIFWIVELVDAARRQFPDPNLKVMWVLIICLGHSAGALAYYIVGKKQGVLPD